jgi:hypothetical protein
MMGGWERLSGTTRADQVVGGEQFAVGAGGTDFEVIAAEVVEEERSSPGVEKGALGIEAGMIGREDCQRVGVGASECVHYLGVVFGGGELPESVAVDFEEVKEKFWFPLGWKGVGTEGDCVGVRMVGGDGGG